MRSKVDETLGRFVGKLVYYLVMVGAILGILLGLSRFPGVSLMAFLGSIATLVLILVMTSGQTVLKKESLLLSGVMVNAFCSSVIMFLVSLTQDKRLHNIIFWLMVSLKINREDRKDHNMSSRRVPLSGKTR